jgi:hypothetical protein
MLYTNPQEKAKNRATGLLAGGVLAPTAVTAAGSGLALGGHALERKLSPKNMLAPERTSKLVKQLRKTLGTPEGLRVNRAGAGHFLGSHFNPISNVVNVSEKASPGILAHELGHASSKMIGGNVIQGLSRRLGSLGAFGSLIAQAYTDPDSATTKALQYGPAALYAPAIAEEVRATTKGLRALSRVGGKGAALRGLLSTVPALATYLGAATAPIWGGKIVQHYANR